MWPPGRQLPTPATDGPQTHGDEATDGPQTHPEGYKDLSELHMDREILFTVNLVRNHRKLYIFCISV